MNPLSSKALLVSVTISQWTARKVDARATDTAHVAHKATRAAGKYHKRLLPDAPELAKISAISSNIRKYVNDQTLPWLTDGTRILSGKNYFNFTSTIQAMRGEFDRAVLEFKQTYPSLKMKAIQDLGDLYTGAEYPDLESLSDKFGVSVDFFPMPDKSDFRVEISEFEKSEFERKIKDTENKAMRDIGNRLLSVLKIATERLSDPSAIFRESLLENIKEMASLVPSLNIHDDPTLDSIGLDTKKLVESLDVEELRKNKGQRNIARDSLQEIELRMGAYMGANK